MHLILCNILITSVKYVLSSFGDLITIWCAEGNSFEVLRQRPIAVLLERSSSKEDVVCTFFFESYYNSSSWDIFFLSGLLTLRMARQNKVDNSILFSVYFGENKAWHFMQIVNVVDGTRHVTTYFRWKLTGRVSRRHRKYQASFSVYGRLITPHLLWVHVCLSEHPNFAFAMYICI